MKKEENIPDRYGKYKKGELDLPSMGSEFPGIPPLGTENPRLLFNNRRETKKFETDSNDQKEPKCFEE